MKRSRPPLPFFISSSAKRLRSFISPRRGRLHCKNTLLSFDKRAFLLAPQVGLEPTTLRLTAECSAIELLRNVAADKPLLLLGSGGVLSSRAVSSQVLSALMGLTSVFGMGTGGTPSPLPPEIASIRRSSRSAYLKRFRASFGALRRLLTTA